MSNLLQSTLKNLFRINRSTSSLDVAATTFDAIQLVEEQQKRIAELEKEVKGYQVALAMPINNEAHNLRQQAKGINDFANAECLTLTSDYEVKLSDAASLYCDKLSKQADEL